MTARGLLTRLGQRVDRGSGSRDEMGDIVEHLRVLLNTRQGDAPTVPEFGIPEFSDILHKFPAAINELRQAIAATITQFEPRLTRVVVRHKPDDDLLVLKYEIVAHLAKGRGVLKVQTQVTAGGRVEIVE